MNLKAGLNLYTVRDHFQKNSERTLEKVAACGFKYIEVINHHCDKDIQFQIWLTAKELNRMAGSNGIKIVTYQMGSLTDPTGIYEKNQIMEDVIDYANILNCEYCVISSDYFSSRDQLLKRCELYNKLGEKFKKNRLNLLYHNHYWDFQRINGDYIFDIMIANTNPDFFNFQIDAYWVMRGLIDPVKIIDKYGTRIKNMHQKDFPLERLDNFNLFKQVNQDVLLSDEEAQSMRVEEDFTELGDGFIKIQENINAGIRNNQDYFFAEQDFSKYDEIVSMYKSMENMRKLSGLTFI